MATKSGIRSFAPEAQLVAETTTESIAGLNVAFRALLHAVLVAGEVGRVRALYAVLQRIAKCAVFGALLTRVTKNLLTLAVVARWACLRTVLLSRQEGAVFAFQTLRGGDALMAVSLTRLTGPPHISDALVEEARRTLAFALMQCREVGGVLALSTVRWAFAKVAGLRALHAQPADFTGALLVVTAGAFLGAPVEACEVPGGLAFLALVPPAALGTVLRAVLANSSDAALTGQLEEAVGAG
mmetsp:Transcript_29999/g.70653  ORF Transcript_29999/g.70653 Transcript_29999/m.70653 type:complete len:241 (+) Transcript_29999:87-809(+)